MLYNGVDLTRFRPRPPSGYLHRELGLPPEASLVASIGQIGMRKGLLTLMAAAREVVDARGQRAFRHRRPALFAETGSVGIRAAGTGRRRQSGRCEAASISWASATTSNGC